MVLAASIFTDATSLICWYSIGKYPSNYATVAPSLKGILTDKGFL